MVISNTTEEVSDDVQCRPTKEVTKQSLQHVTDRQGQVTVGNQTFTFSYHKDEELGNITVVIDDFKITYIKAKEKVWSETDGCVLCDKVEFQGSSLVTKYKKVLNQRVNTKMGYNTDPADVYYFPYANFYCYKHDGKLCQPVYSHDTLQPAPDMLIVNDHLYGSYRDDYNNNTIYHHGLVMNHHVTDGKYTSIPAHLYDTAVILNEIQPSLHYILLV